jgi:hypothetical protein
VLADGVVVGQILPAGASFAVVPLASREMLGNCRSGAAHDPTRSLMKRAGSNGVLSANGVSAIAAADLLMVAAACSVSASIIERFNGIV